MKKSIITLLALALFALTGTANAATLYWDTNGAAAGFGTGGTWGTDAFWTTDDTGGFSDGGTATTTAADSVQVNKDNVAFSMDVSGDVDAYNIVGIQSSTTSTFNGAGTIHLHASGSANPLFTGGGDMKVTVNTDLVLDAAVGSTAYLAQDTGNNSNVTLTGSITSTNIIDLVYADTGSATITSASGSIDLQGGSFTVDQPYGYRIKDVNVGGVISSGVNDVTMTSPLGGHSTNKGRLILANANNAYTGDTTLDDSRIRITTDTSLPDTTTVYITGTGMFELNNPGTDVIAGLYLDGVEQLPGIYNASSHSQWFLGNGSLSVVPIPEPASLALFGLGGLMMVTRRRKA